MKKIILSTVAMLLLSTTINAQSHPQHIVSEGKPIESIDVATGINIYIHRAGSRSSSEIVIYSEDGNFDCLEYSFSYGEFSIKYTPEYLKKRNKSRREQEVKRYVHISTPYFTELEASSSADIIVEDNFYISDLDIDASSSATVIFKQSIDVNGDVAIDASSSADIIYKGDLDIDGDLAIKVSSSADLTLGDVRVGDDVSINTSSSAGTEIAYLDVYSGTASLTSSSSGDIVIREGVVRNNTDQNNIGSSSGGDIDCINVRMNNIKASASSGANIKIFPLKYMYITKASSGGGIYYRHTDGVEIDGINNISSGGKVKKY